MGLKTLGFLISLIISRHWPSESSIETLREPGEGSDQLINQQENAHSTYINALANPSPHPLPREWSSPGHPRPQPTDRQKHRSTNRLENGGRGLRNRLPGTVEKLQNGRND